MSSDAPSTAAAARAPSAALSSLLSSVSPCSLTPHSLFVSWSGVLTLSFVGWPAPLSDLKSRLNSLGAADWGLAAENSGSMWPKMTLGCLQEGRTLSAAELTALLRLTLRFRSAVQAHSWRLRVRTLSPVLFVCCSLERLLFRGDVRLVGAGSADDHSDCTAESQRTVESVLAELEDTDESIAAYLPRVNQSGGRTKHYTQPKPDSTLVAFAADGSADADPADSADPPSFLSDFQRAVDELLPGAYTFFPWASLHCTIRALTAAK